jgi:predicted ATP-grasp superfamily ATP-dependent carboligase
MQVLIAGVSTRAAAESAARAGFDVTAIDAYADLDQHSAVRALSVPRDFGMRSTAHTTAAAARSIDCDAVAYLSSFENYPRALATLAAGRALWGNPPDILGRVRDPLVLASTLRQHGFTVPDVRLLASARLAASCGKASPQLAEAAMPRAEAGPNDWLVKPLRSGGGRRVRAWRGGRIPRDCYLQQRIEGTPGSIVFVAVGGRAVPLAVSRQLIGDAAFGAVGYRYCGNILAPADDPQFASGISLLGAACALARVVAAEFRLTGLNGIDFIAREGVPYPIEVNPRWSASMELVEQVFGLAVFGLHADACGRGVLPDVNLTADQKRGRAVGKAIVFARRDVVTGDTRPWLADPTVRDVPHRGQRFGIGQPVCTVFATGPDGGGCYRALVRRATAIYSDLAAWEATIASATLEQS